MSWMFSVGCCCGASMASCCDVDDLPETATLTYQINELAPVSITLTKLGNGYASYEDFCEVGDGVTIIGVAFNLNCFEDSYWVLEFNYTVYIKINEFEYVLANYASWSYQYFWEVNADVRSELGSVVGTSPNGTTWLGSGTISCLPCFGLTFEGVNTDGQDGWSDNPQVCSGETFPFGPAGTVNLQLAITGLCDDIECPSNPDELMPSVLKCTATVCDIETELPDLFYQEITPGVFGWFWGATEVEPAVPLVAITGCAGSDASWEGHTLCFQAVQLQCGETPGGWPGLSLSMYNYVGLVSNKSSSGFSLTDTSPFDITYEFTDAGDISGAGCCLDETKKIYVRIYEA